MLSFKVTLSCFTGAHTVTYVMANDQLSARTIAEARVNKKSPNGWRADSIVAEYKPDDFVDTWNRD